MQEGVKYLKGKLGKSSSGEAAEGREAKYP